MGHVFVSHAAADAALVTPFVDRILQLGCGLTDDEIFYSSDREKGVPSGSTLLTYVQEKVSSADLVIAIITPMFQTRPVCVAELGAAWSRAGRLFPIAVPGMARTDMEGVMAGVTVLYLDHEDALDELNAAVSEAVHGEQRRPGKWTPHKKVWLAVVGDLATKVASPSVVTAEEHQLLKEELAGTQEALEVAAAEAQALKDQVERIRAAGSDEKAKRAALLPSNEIERFELARKETARKIGNLPPEARDVMRHEITDGPMPWPSGWGNDSDDIRSAKQAGWLVENSDELLVTNRELPRVRAAWDAFETLEQDLEEGGYSEEFYEWFEQEYEVPANLRFGLAWDALF